MATRTKKFENLKEGTVIAAVSPGASHIAYFTTLDSDGTLTFELEGMTGETVTIDLKTTENKFSKTVKGKFGWMKLGAWDKNGFEWDLYLDPRDIFYVEK